MKKIIITGLSILLYNVNGMAQSTTATNIQGGGQPNYLGFSNNFEVRLRSNNINRMITAGGTAASNQGNVAFGNALPNGFAPQSRLHLYQTDGFNNLRFTTDGTGHGANDGFQIGIGSTGDVSFINNELNQNFSWYNQGGGTPGTLLGRMRLYDGGVGQTTGRLLIGNDLPFVFIPLDRFHLYENANSGFNAIRFQNTLTGTTGNDGYRTGISNTNRDVLHTQFENRPIRWELPTTDLTGLQEWMRIQHGGAVSFANNTNGYIGLNNTNVSFHIDGRTPAATNAGELFLSFRPTDVDNSRMGMLNATGTDNRFLPTVFGNVDQTQPWSGLQTIAAIHTTQDISANLVPVQRFIVGKNWVYNANSLVPLETDLDSISERNAFSWQNGGNVNMLMDAFGKLRIGAAINLATPLTNRVTITAALNDPGQGSVATPGGSSGLQFTNLKAISPTLSNPGVGVLAVDSLGNVIYVPNDAVGNYCSASPIVMTDDYRIDLSDYTYNFITQGSGSVNVGDVFCGVFSDSKFYVRNNMTTQNAIRGESNHSNGIGGNFGGGKYGVYAIASITSGSSSAFPTTAAIYSDGDAIITGTPYVANPVILVSDSIFKSNINPITNAMDIINNLNPVSYYYTPNTFDNRIHFNQNQQYGFIAQDIETILPELITNGHLAPVNDSLGNEMVSELEYKGVNYNSFIAILTKGIKEQQHVINTQDSVINDLNTRLTTLENCLSGILPFLCQLSNSSIQQNDEQTQQNIIKELKVQLNNSQSIVLGQNVPNPFAEQTVIEYFIPEAVKQAQIIFYNQTGQIINTVDIEEMGDGRLTVFANDLSTGVYTYTLVADGQVITTKKMVKTK